MEKFDAGQLVDTFVAELKDGRKPDFSEISDE